MLANHLMETLPLITREWHSELDHGLPADVSPVQYRVLYFLEQGPARGACLAKRTGVTPAAMSRTVEQLAKGGYVQRTPSRQDRREVLLALTAKGEDVVGKVGRQVARRLQIFFEALTQKEQEQIEAGLKLVLKAFTGKG
jgi:DNA-binding MarR family transcriptional regulator